MNTSLFWMGLLPIAAYVLVDSFAKKRTALYASLGLGVLELVYTLVQFGRLDYLTFFTFVFLGGFIFLSLRLNNDVYFKIQGAILNIIFALILLCATLFFDTNILLDMTIKYMGLETASTLNPLLSPELLTKMLTAMNIHLPWWLFAHSALTIIAAYRWNKWIWVAIRVPGFYIMLIVMMQFIGLQTLSP